MMLFRLMLLLIVYLIGIWTCEGKHYKYGPEMKIKILNEKSNEKHPDCRSLHLSGYNISGVYRLYLNHSEVVLPCVFEDGKGYTVIQQRFHGSVSFSQGWHAYEVGFGHPSTDFWAGLANIYQLTVVKGNTHLQIRMTDWSLKQYIVNYGLFLLGVRDTRYALRIGGYSGYLLDEMSYHNGMPFSTIDAPDPRGCAVGMDAGWWYNYCAYTLLNGKYYLGGTYYPLPGKMYDGIFWKDLYGYNYSLKEVIMLVY